MSGHPPTWFAEDYDEDDLSGQGVEWVRFPHDFEESLATGLWKCRKCGYAPRRFEQPLGPPRGNLVCYEQNIAGERRWP